MTSLYTSWKNWLHQNVCFNKNDFLFHNSAAHNFKLGEYKIKMKMHPIQVLTSFGIWLNLGLNLYTWYHNKEKIIIYIRTPPED